MVLRQVNSVSQEKKKKSNKKEKSLSQWSECSSVCYWRRKTEILTHSSGVDEERTLTKCPVERWWNLLKGQVHKTDKKEKKQINKH